MQQCLRIPRLNGVLGSDPQSVRMRLLEEGVQGTLESQAWDPFKVDPKEVSVRFSIAFVDTTVAVLFRIS